MKIVIILLVILILGFLMLFNLFKKRKNAVNEAFATMDVYLKKRWDLIPNLVETVKGYASYESNTLKEIIAQRSNYDNLNNDEKLETNGKVTNQLTKLFALVESYPEIKANTHFLELQKSLSLIEDEIASSRKYYNAVVRVYNNLVETFPSNIVAKLFGYKSLKMFEASVEEKHNVEVNLNENKE
ncbi:MAG: LemA family protein [Bacilli bacterium]|nr:LemA family protein [Bacilli bacterium]